MGEIRINLRKILFGIYIVLVVSVMILLVLHNKDEFIYSTNRIKDLFLAVIKLDFKELKTFFEVYLDASNIIYDEVVDEVVGGVTDFVEEVIIVKESWDVRLVNFLNSFLVFVCDFVIYFANVGMNLFMIMFVYFNEVFNGTQYNIKTSKAASFYLLITRFSNKIKEKIILFLRYLKNKIREHRRFIALNILLILVGNGILYKILVELLLLIVIYIYKAIVQETYLLIFAFFKYVVVLLYPYLKSIPLWLFIPSLIVILFFIAKSKAEFRLLKNHERLKNFTKDTLTQTTFINGPPGSGKTLLNVSLSLASEEVFIDELEKKLLEYELKYPYFNFATLRTNTSTFNQEHSEYIDTLKFLCDRRSYIISNYAIYSPYFRQFSKIFDFNFMRKNKQNTKYALEEYTIISISELDKEYNSHDDMKKVGEDGAATFFSTVSHDLKRHCKIFCDYQLKDQVPLRIRGNSEYFYTINERKKKYPFLLGLYYLPIKSLSKLVRKLILKYETKRPFITKNTKRKSVSEYKRNDISIVYLILKQMAYTLNKISNFFDKYWYFRLKGTLSMQDGAKGEEKNICLNICDLSIENMALYDSTFLSYAYEEKKNFAFKDLEKFTSLTPSTEELNKCNSYFYNKLNGVEEPKKETKNESDDEYIIINN